MTNTIYHTLRSAGQSYGTNLALVQHEDSFERTLIVHAVYQLADAIGTGELSETINQITTVITDQLSPLVCQTNRLYFVHLMRP